MNFAAELFLSSAGLIFAVIIASVVISKLIGNTEGEK